MNIEKIEALVKYITDPVIDNEIGVSVKYISKNKPDPITEYLDTNNQMVNPNVVDRSAIYLFWYKNNDHKLQSLSHELKIIDPNRKLYPPPIFAWNTKQDYVCLYVDDGTNFDNRLGQQGRLNQHLLPETPENIYNEDSAFKNNEKYRENSSSQFRKGFDFLYRKQPETIILDEIRERIYITILYKSDHTIHSHFGRYLIGMLEPWCNLIEQR